MIQKLLNFSEKMFNHIKSFQEHFGIRTFSEAVRQLILDGFKYNGFPLDEEAHRAMGKNAREVSLELELKEQAEHQERYENLMRQLGFNPDGTRKENDD